MKKYFYFLLTASVMFSACSEESSENQSSNFNFVWGDTLMVDTGDSFIDLSNGLDMADVTVDKRQLMHYSQNKNELSIINLDEMKLEKQVQFETDGPNNVESPFWMKIIGNGSELMLNGYSASLKFNLDGIRLDKIYTRGSLASRSLSGDSLSSSEGITSGASSINPSGRYFYGHYFGFDEGQISEQSIGIVEIDLVNKSLKKVFIPELKKLLDYEIYYSDGGGAPSIGYLPYFFLWSDDDRVLISNSCINEVIIYHRKEDSVEVKSYQSKLSANQKDPPIKKHNNDSYYNEYIKTSQDQIDFNKLVYDADHKVFIRFSTDTDLSRTTVDKKVKRNIITVFDQDLNMIQEAIIPEFTEASISNYFIKDGKVYITQNLDDEVAFLTISIQK